MEPFLYKLYAETPYSEGLETHYSRLPRILMSARAYPANLHDKSITSYSIVNYIEWLNLALEHTQCITIIFQ
eukprot:SAG31_NODE_25020_length_469_cov_1.851351_1_plen_71_part_01